MLRGPRTGLDCLAFAPRGDVLAAAGRGPGVWLYDVTARKVLGAFAEDRAHFEALAFSPDGSMLGGCSQGSVYLWNTRTPAHLRALAAPHGAVQAVAFAADSTLATVAGDRVTVWRTDGTELRSFAGGGWVSSFTADARRVVGQERGPPHTVCVWDVASGKRVALTGPDTPGLAGLALAPDGRLLATADQGAERLNLRRLPGGALAGSVRCPAAILMASELEPNSPVAAVGGAGMMGGGGLGTVSLNPGIFRGLAFSPAGGLVAGAWEDGVRLWQLEPAGKGLAVRTLALVAAPEQARRVTLSPDGHSLACAVDGQGVRVLETARGDQRILLRGDGAYQRLAFSPDGTLLAAGAADGEVVVWDLARAEPVRRWRGHRGAVTALAFSASGRRLASGSLDATVLVWDVPRPAAPPGGATPRALADGWADLAGADAARAYRAIGGLAANPAPALTLLAEHLKPGEPLDPKRIAGLIADLDDKRFAVRQRATSGLRQLGQRITPVLRQALAGKPTPEVRRRVEDILARQEDRLVPAGQVREWRAVEVLERVATAQSRELLRRLAAGAPDAALTREAKAALERLERRAPAGSSVGG
jgi:WD40 repeat protein